MYIFSIYDSKAEAHMQPFFAGAPGVAIRQFDELCNDKEHPVGKHAEDYTLMELGTWNEREGRLVVYEVSKAKGNGLDFKRSD